MAAGVHPEYVRRLTRQGKLTGVGRGLYALPTIEPTELRFHELGTQNPREVWIAIDRRAGMPRLDFTPVRIVRLSGAALTDGIESHERHRSRNNRWPIFDLGHAHEFLK